VYRTWRTIEPIGSGSAVIVCDLIHIKDRAASAGVAMNNRLFYATGGAAFIKSSANGTSIAGSPCGTAGVLTNCSASAWRPV